MRETETGGPTPSQALAVVTPIVWTGNSPRVTRAKIHHSRWMPIGLMKRSGFCEPACSIVDEVPVRSPIKHGELGILGLARQNTFVMWHAGAQSEIIAQSDEDREPAGQEQAEGNSRHRQEGKCPLPSLLEKPMTGASNAPDCQQNRTTQKRQRQEWCEGIDKPRNAEGTENTHQRQDEKPVGYVSRHR